jgi:uncharacterized Zn ribbon protein
MKEKNQCPQCDWPLNYEDQEQMCCPHCGYSWGENVEE